MKNPKLNGKIKYTWFTHGGGVFFLKKEWIDHPHFHGTKPYEYAIIARIKEVEQ